MRTPRANIGVQPIDDPLADGRKWYAYVSWCFTSKDAETRLGGEVYLTGPLRKERRKALDDAARLRYWWTENRPTLG